MRKLRRATSDDRFQLTTDGLKAYETAVDEIISDRVDFAQLIKIYASSREGEQRYSPAEVVEAVPVIVSGDPDKKRICTSIVKRQNLTMRMHMRRLTPSECLQQEAGEPQGRDCAALRLLQLLQDSRQFARDPCDGSGYFRSCLDDCGADGVTDRVWDVEDIVKLLENKLEDLNGWREAYFTR
jgi:hypothetical protein